MDIVKRLKAKPPKGFVTSPLMIEAATEIERLRQQNADLLEFVNKVANMNETPIDVYCVSELAELIIAKATGGE